MPGINYCFTCGDSDLSDIIKKWQNIWLIKCFKNQRKMFHVFIEIIIYILNELYIQRNDCSYIQQNNYLYIQRINYLYIQRNNCLCVQQIIYLFNEIIILIQRIIYIFNEVITYIFNEMLIFIQRIIYIFNEVIIFIQTNSREIYGQRNINLQIEIWSLFCMDLKEKEMKTLISALPQYLWSPNLAE